MADLKALAERASIAADCTDCALHAGRRQVVWADGNPETKVMFIGEGPGQQEDEQGKPFVGAAGQLLDRILSAIQLDRSQVYIANVVKCRPPQNRDPKPEEIQACLNHLRWQVHCIKPAILVCLGAVAARTIIDPEFRITQERGQWIQRGEYLLMATYHPAALLRDPSKKPEAWQDFQALQAKLAAL